MTKFYPQGRLQKGMLRLVEASNIDNIVMSQTFKYNPNRIKDTKSTKWAEHTIPGVSHPVYQYVSGGPRKLEFTLFITGDDGGAISVETIEQHIKFFQAIAYAPSQSGGVTGIAPYLIEFNFGTYYGSSDEGNPVTNAMSEGLAQGIGKIQSAISDIPVIGSGSTINNLLGSFKPYQAPKKTLWLMENVEVEVTKWRSNLAPTQAEVSLVLKEYTSTSIDFNTFMNRSG